MFYVTVGLQYSVSQSENGVDYLKSREIGCGKGWDMFVALVGMGVGI